MTKLFLDSNVVIYSLDPRDRSKQDRCLQWLSRAAARSSFTISAQVCAESRSAAVRKLGLKPRSARDAIERLLPWCTAPMTADEVRRALELVEARRMSWWGALIFASAIGAGYTHLVTEDGQSAPVVDGVRIIDPFAVAPEEVLGA